MSREKDKNKVVIPKKRMQVKLLGNTQEANYISKNRITFYCFVDVQKEKKTIRYKKIHMKKKRKTTHRDEQHIDQIANEQLED